MTEHNKLEMLMAGLPEDIDAALITSPVNRRYYTGFPSSAGTVLATRNTCYLIIDSRYFEAAQQLVKSCQVVLQNKLTEQLSDLFKHHGIKTVGVESASVDLQEFSILLERFPSVTLLEDNRLQQAIDAQRQIKESWELEAIQEAQNIADKTFSHILGVIAPGQTEREIALEMEFFSRRLGSEEPAFPFIVVSGSNSSMPHGVPCNKPVEPGDFITMDFGATVRGYRSDMTRTVAVGHVTDEQRLVYQTVLDAQLAALDAVRPGSICSEVDQVARDIIDERDGSRYAGRFGHGLGHSLGLDIHESPSFSPSCHVLLQPGMVMSVEPGIYLPGAFGVRIEDVVVVTDNGYRNFVSSPKELLVL